MVEIERPPAVYGFQLLQRSRSYLKAFESLTAADDVELRSPAYFLLCNAAEFALKGYLASYRISEQRLHGYQHRLGKLLAACYRHGLEYDGNLDQLVASLVGMTNEDDFRYLADFRLTVADTATCCRTMDKLYAAISPQIHAAHDVAYQRILLEGHDENQFHLIRPKRRRSVAAAS